MAPGILLDDSHLQSDTSPPSVDEEEQQLPSYLVGPPLKVEVPIALDLFRSACEKHKDLLAVASLYQPADYLHEIFQDGPQPLPAKVDANHLRWSFAQVAHAGELLAAGLAANGVHEGMTLACFAKGSVEFYMILYASLILRCRFSPMNPAATANSNEARNMLQVTSANVLISMDDEAIERVEATLPDLMKEMVLKVSTHDLSQDRREKGWTTVKDLVIAALPISSARTALERFEDIRIDPDDDVYILFTSGTSSLPKACPLTNRTMCSMATNFAIGPTGGPGAVVCNHLPIYHIAGGISAGWNPLTSGAAAVHPAPAFTAGSTLTAMKVEGVTFMILVPSMLGLIADDPALPPPGELSIRSVSLGASTILYTDVEKCYALLGAKRVITSYGMTEGLMMTRGHLPREVTKAALNGIQSISAGARLKICKPNSREIVPRGEPGEVHQGGATTIRGYIGTKTNAFYEDEDGIWCMTGDQAIMHPDGGVQITGRYKDIIIRGGVNVSPSAIEGVIAKILKIEAHVVGMPDSIAGEVPVAIVRKSDIGTNSAAKLREPIVKELGPKFALEKFITLEELGMTEFPATSTGKIRKIDLQAAVKKYAIERQGAADESKPSSGGSTLERLMRIWSDVAGLTLEELTAESSVQDLADSLMLSRYANVVKNAFSAPFTLDDLTKQPTLGAQAELLEERLDKDGGNADLANSREGPPTVEDMVHCADNPEVAARTQTLVESFLKPMGFEWADVEQVCTPTQWLQSWVKSRETSDRFRAAYITNEADVTRLAAAIEETLRRNDSLRAISIPVGDGTDIQVILRHTPKWIKRVISIRDEPVEKILELEKLIPGDYKLEKGLAQVVIAHCNETGTAGAALMTLHTTFDAFSLDTMRKDMNTILNKQKPKQHVPYKLWADHLYNQRESKPAMTAIKFNVERLNGLGNYRQALWPKQRTKVWQRGTDRGLTVNVEGQVTTRDDPKARPLFDGAASMGSIGLRREHALQDIVPLTAQHRMPPPVIVKAALALLETSLTGQDVALFSQTFAMRDNWPFIDDWISRRLPSPLEVTGPCLSRIAEIIPVDPDMIVMDWLQKLKREQEILVKHAHAPYREVFDQLNARSDARLNGNGHSIQEHPNGVTNGLSNGVSDAPTNGVKGYATEVNGHVNGVNGHANGIPNGISSGLKKRLSGARERPSMTGRPKSGSVKDTIARGRRYTTGEAKALGLETSAGDVLPPARDGDVMESIRKRINFQWLPIFGLDKGVKPQVRVASSSHFNEVGLAVKSGMLADRKTVWIKMEWDDGNIRKSDAQAWIDEMIALVEILGKEENWGRKVSELWSFAPVIEMPMTPSVGSPAVFTPAVLTPVTPLPNPLS